MCSAIFPSFICFIFLFGESVAKSCALDLFTFIRFPFHLFVVKSWQILFASGCGQDLFAFLFVVCSFTCLPSRRCVDGQNLFAFLRQRFVVKGRQLPFRQRIWSRSFRFSTPCVCLSSREGFFSEYGQDFFASLLWPIVVKGRFFLADVAEVFSLFHTGCLSSREFFFGRDLFAFLRRLFVVKGRRISIRYFASP